MTSRPLKPNELFEVKLDKIVSKWAGSIEIGVTTHSPTELEFPYTMTNVRYIYDSLQIISWRCVNFIIFIYICNYQGYHVSYYLKLLMSITDQVLG